MHFSELPEMKSGEKTYTAYEVKLIIEDAISGAYHPEFGTEWREPDGGLYLLTRDMMRSAWNSGYYDGWNDCTELRQENPTKNPYE